MLNLPGEKLNLSAPISAIFGSKRGCLHVESAFLAVGEAACTSSRRSTYEEVIDRFNLRLAAEPPSSLTSRLDTFADPLAGARHLNLGVVW